MMLLTAQFSPDYTLAAGTGQGAKVLKVINKALTC